MNADWIHLFHIREKLLASYSEILANYQIRLRKLRRTCDHTNPDGSTAINPAYDANCCTICGAFFFECKPVWMDEEWEKKEHG